MQSANVNYTIWWITYLRIYSTVQAIPREILLSDFEQLFLFLSNFSKTQLIIGTFFYYIKMDTFFRLSVYKKVRISQAEVYENVKNLSVGFKRAFNENISNRRILWLYHSIYLGLHWNDKKISFSGDLFIVQAGYNSMWVTFF